MQSWIVASVARGPDQTLQGFGIAMCVKKKVIVTTPKRTAMSCKRRFPTKITKSLGLRPIDLRPPEPQSVSHSPGGIRRIRPIARIDPAMPRGSLRDKIKVRRTAVTPGNCGVDDARESRPTGSAKLNPK